MKEGINSTTHTPPGRPDVFDLLIEQRDQELACDGVVSPFTALQLEAYCNGEPIPHVDLNAPGIKAATTRLLRCVRELREVQTSAHAAVVADEDDLWGNADE